MKKKGRISLFAVSCLVLGGVLFVIGMSVLDWNFLRLDSNDWVKGTYVSEEEVASLASLDIALTDADLELVFEEERTEISVEYEQCDNAPMEIELKEEEGNAGLTVHQRRKFVLFKMFDFHTAQVKVYLPKSVGNASISVTNGEITVSGGNAEKFEVSAVNADIKISALVALGEISVKNTNGDIELSSVSVEDSGGIMRVTAFNGSIRPDKIRAADMEIKNTNGTIYGKHVVAADMRCTNVNGSINLESAHADDMHFSNVNGAVKVMLTGKREDYTIRCNSVNGKVKEPNRDGGEYLFECSTTNGNISLTFLKAEAV